MADKKSDPPATDVVTYKDEDGRTHWASRNAPKVVDGLAKGTIKLVGEAAPDAAKVSKPSDAPNPRSAGS